MDKELQERDGQLAGAMVKAMYADHPLVKAIEQGGCKNGRCPAADRLQMAYARLFKRPVVKKRRSRRVATARDLKGFSFSEFLHGKAQKITG